MTALDSLITNLDDAELVVNLLEKLGKNHKRHGIKETAFDVSIFYLCFNFF